MEGKSMVTDGEPLPKSIKVQPPIVPLTRSTSSRVRSYRQDLAEVVSQYFPQYGPLEYVPMEVSSQEATIASPTLRCSLRLLGLTIEAAETFDSWEEAQEETARLGLSLVKEFLGLLMARQDNSLFESALRPMIRNLDSFPSLASSQPEASTALPRGAVSEEHPMGVLTMEDDYEVREARQSFLGPLLGPILGHRVNSPRRDTEKKAICSAPPDGTAKISDQQSRVTTEDNPISFLYRHWQRHSSSTTLARPEIEGFARAPHFGAVGRYAGHEVFVEAFYLRKNAARQEAARLLCLRIVDDVLPFKPIPPDRTIEDKVRDHGQTMIMDTGTRASSETDKQSLWESPDPGSRAVRNREALVVTNASRDGLDPDVMAKLPPGSLMEGGERLSGRSSSIVLLNEFCQKMHLPIPEYVFYHNVKDGPTQAYWCRVAAFPVIADELTVTEGSLPPARSFMSELFRRKRDAKEDCAGRIVKYLIEEGSMTPQGQPSRSPPSSGERRAPRLDHDTVSLTEQSPMVACPVSPPELSRLSATLLASYTSLTAFPGSPSESPSSSPLDHQYHDLPQLSPQHQSYDQRKDVLDVAHPSTLSSSVIPQKTLPAPYVPKERPLSRKR